MFEFKQLRLKRASVPAVTRLQTFRAEVDGLKKKTALNEDFRQRDDGKIKLKLQETGRNQNNRPEEEKPGV